MPKRLRIRNPVLAHVDTEVIYCGDNLEQLQQLPDGCIDMIYLDPPFNSNRNYEVFWGEDQEKRAFEDRHDSTQAYIAYMRPRCIQLARILSGGGSLYYHCDWHASHYVKVMLDEIIGERNFINEVIWKRQSAHNDARQGSKHLGRVHDTLLLYAKGKGYTFNHLYRPYDPEYVEKFYRNIESDTGRRYSLGDITAPGGAAPSKGNPCYEFLGVTRYWRFSRERMEELHRAGRIVQSKPGAVPRQKRYLDEAKGVPLGTVWDDIAPVQGSQRIGYPTQKPVELLRRLVRLSSNPDDIILDPFCGCGTALAAAQELKRHWIGIDVSPTACRVMSKRLRDGYNLKENESLRSKSNMGFALRNLPWTPERLRTIPPFEFESWAILALNGQKNPSHVGDMGIDGKIFPLVRKRRPKKDPQLSLFDMPNDDDWYPVQVKQSPKVGRPDIDLFETAMLRENRKIGFFVGFDYTSDARREVTAFFKRTGCQIKLLTVNAILSGDISTQIA